MPSRLLAPPVPSTHTNASRFILCYPLNPALRVGAPTTLAAHPAQTSPEIGAPTRRDRVHYGRLSLPHSSYPLLPSLSCLSGKICPLIDIIKAIPWALLGGCLIYEIVLDIFFRFLGLVFFISSIYIVGCRGNCSLFFGLKVQELGFGIRGRDGGQCNPRKCFAAFVEHAQLEDAPLWIRFVPSSQSLPAFFFVFSLFFGSWGLLSFYQWQQHLDQLIPDRPQQPADRPALWHAIFTQTFQ